MEAARIVEERGVLAVVGGDWVADEETSARLSAVDQELRAKEGRR